MAMASNPTCLSYDRDAETISEFITRFSVQCSEQLHRVRNDDTKLVALLMRALPVSVFTDVQRALSPASITDVTYEEIKKTLTRLYTVKKSVLGASVQFYNCKQKPGQSVEEFSRDIRYFSQQCGFDASVPLSRIQRDVFLAGLSSASVVTSILQISDDIAFEEAVNKATVFTQLRHDTSMINQPINQVDNSVDVFNVQQAALPSSYVCIRCGQRAKHRAQNCYALTLKCNICSKIGHISRMCKSRGEQHKKLFRDARYKQENKQCNYMTEGYDTSGEMIGLSGKMSANYNDTDMRHVQYGGSLSGCTRGVAAAATVAASPVTSSNTPLYPSNDSHSVVKPVHLRRAVANDSSLSPTAISSGSVNGGGLSQSLGNNDSYNNNFFILNTNVIPVTSEPTIIKCSLNSVADICFELDTGAGCSIISERVYQYINVEINDTLRKVTAYDGGVIDLIGEATCLIKLANDSHYHTFLVARGNKVNIFGRDLLNKFNFQIVQRDHVINSISSPIFSEFHDYLNSNFVSNVRESVQLDMPVDAKPVYIRARQIPVRLKTNLKSELDRLVLNGIITPVYSSEWATPIVIVHKKDGSLRLCADFSCTVNKYLKAVNSPLITVDEAIASVGNAKIFSKLDLSQAFMQIPIHSESRKYLVINTSEGLFQFNYLPFGLIASSGIFQAFISRVLANIPGVICYQDDILLMSDSIQSHNKTLRVVLTRMKNAGLKLNVDKCKFFTDHVEYLGFIFDNTGVHPNPSKLSAIKDAPVPVDLKQVQSFIGLCNFYSRFIPHFATKMSPFYDLMKKNVNFNWTKLHQTSFEQIKDDFHNCNILQHFNPEFQTCLETDSSSYGVGAVLLQRRTRAEHWLPIQFASRSLNPAEKNYSQLEREALSVIFGLEKFKHFLLGSHFIIKNDHKPLHSLFARDKPIPNTCSARVLRWALKLAQFDYIFQYSCGRDNVQSDFCSRLPLPETVEESEPFELVFSINLVHDDFIDHSIVKAESERDPIFVLLMNYIRQGCFNKIDSSLSSIKSLIPYMTICKGCVMYNDKVFLPLALRHVFLKKLHINHPGIVAMKTLARELVWYPGINRDIEYLVSNCPNCQAHRIKPPQTSFVTWPTPPRPWSRIHIDHFFYKNNTCLIAVDAYSHYIEIEIVKNTSVVEVIEALKTIFSRNGLPDVLCSDNASCFTSYIFADYLKKNGIEHITSPPYCPSSNGLAERGVQIIKQLLKKLDHNSLLSFKSQLSQILLYQRSTPHSQTQVVPSFALNNRKYVNAHDKIHPKLSHSVSEQNHNKKMAQFDSGDNVLALNLSRGPKWLKATIVKRLGVNVYTVYVPDLDITWKRHVTQLCNVISRPNS